MRAKPKVENPKSTVGRKRLTEKDRQPSGSGLLSVAKTAQPGELECHSPAVLKRVDEHGGSVPDE
jgi:hypothetical protein